MEWASKGNINEAESNQNTGSCPGDDCPGIWRPYVLCADPYVHGVGRADRRQDGV